MRYSASSTAIQTGNYSKTHGLNSILLEQSEITIQSRVSKDEYISTVNKIKEHIQRGDIYELNYCIEFFTDHAQINPQSIYKKLNALSPMPFSCFYRMDSHYLICASPER